jgi:hypothetical protein
MTHRRPSLETAKQLITILLAAAILIGSAIAASAQSLSLYGTLQRTAGTVPAAVIGAKIVLRQPSGEQVGLALTDGFGRFAFYDVNSGRYHLVVYVDGRVASEEDVTAPGPVAPIVLR